MITFKFNEGDLKRITGKLEKLKQNARGDNRGPLFKIAWKYTTEYQQTIVEAMGSVWGEDGGDPGITYSGISKSVDWTPLAERTLRDKRAQGLGLYVWDATGATKKAVKVRKVVATPGALEIFAGISQSSNPVEYERALLVEYGADGAWPQRALFTITNDLFAANRANIVTALRTALTEGVNWGSR